METELLTFLSMFLLLLISSGVFLWSKKITSIPYSVLLVIVGIGIGLIAQFPGMSVLSEFELTPDLLFFIFLPVLIFESAYNVNVRSFYESLSSITLLSTLGLFVGAGIIGLLITLISTLLGFQIPILVSLLFGAIISATDPVAVLSVFKETGAPHRLSLIVEGESLFNDGTAVALFLAIMLIIQEGYQGLMSWGSSFGLFLSMVFGGILFGAVIGRVFSSFIKMSRQHELSALTMMLVMAHLTFLGAEYINELFSGANYLFAISPIIATTVASLELGNNGKLSLSARTNEFFHKFWGGIAFMANSIVFILMGMLFVKLNFFESGLLAVTGIAILATWIARVVSVHFSMGLVNFFKLEPDIPESWIKLMSWGSLRGALAVIVVLTIPDSLSIANWPFDYSVKSFILALTIGVVGASLVFKATTVKAMMKKLKIFELSEAEKLRLDESKSLVASLELERLRTMHEKGYIDTPSYTLAERELRESIRKCSERAHTDTSALLGIFKIYAIGIEQFYLQELYARNEVTERIYRHVYAKLILQTEKVEHSYLERDRYGRFGTRLMRDRIDKYRKRLSKGSTSKYSVTEKYLYYRCLSIIARKVLKELDPKYFPQADCSSIETVLEEYREYANTNKERMKALHDEHPGMINTLNHKLLMASMQDFDRKTYHKLFKTHFLPSNLRRLLESK